MFVVLQIWQRAELNFGCHLISSIAIRWVLIPVDLAEFPIMQRIMAKTSPSSCQPPTEPAGNP